MYSLSCSAHKRQELGKDRPIWSTHLDTVHVSLEVLDSVISCGIVALLSGFKELGVAVGDLCHLTNEDAPPTPTACARAQAVRCDEGSMVVIAHGEDRGDAASGTRGGKNEVSNPASVGA